MLYRIATACLALVLMAGVPAAAQEASDVCRPQLEDELKSRGVAMDDLLEQDWVPETQNSSPGHEQISGYQFYAQPASCTKGRLVARMDANCRITQIYTRRGCAIEGVRAK